MNDDFRLAEPGSMFAALMCESLVAAGIMADKAAHDPPPAATDRGESD